MAIQIPEPDFYTLAEVAERWGISQDILLRLGVERKIIIGEGVIPPVNMINLQGILDDSPSMARFLFSDWVNVVDGDMQEIDTSEPVPKKIYMKVIDSAELIYTIEYSEALKNKPEGLRIDPRINNDDLVIPTCEIHRIEHQREAAKKANAEDILGTRERETMQAVIAAMTQFIAGTATKYKRNERPNVDAISGALKDVIPDRTKRGISETISRALKAGLTRT